MRTSYQKNNIDYGDIFQLLVWLYNPQKIVEFGILDGFSLENLAKYSSPSCQIEAYDIFDGFNGNHANYQSIADKFGEFSNIKIKKGNFFESYQSFQEDSIDLIHIDIANDGSTYKFAFENYWSKLKKGGLLIMEGGSKDRDNIDWMQKYQKIPIQDVLKKCPHKLFTLEKFPSLSIFHKE